MSSCALLCLPSLQRLESMLVASVFCLRHVDALSWPVSV